MTDEQIWLATAAHCERIAAARDANGEHESAARWRSHAIEALERARDAARGEEQER